MTVLRKISEDAVATFGSRHQLVKAVEECGELITAICQMQDRRIPLGDIASEIADVEIMCEQLRVIIGDQHIDKARDSKIERLAQTIKFEKCKGAKR